jgi:hypothetical protein
MSCNRRDDENVAGAFDRGREKRRPVRVMGVVDQDDLCRAVRECLEDLLAGAEDDRRDRCHRRNGGFGF